MTGTPVQVVSLRTEKGNHLPIYMAGSAFSAVYTAQKSLDLLVYRNSIRSRDCCKLIAFWRSPLMQFHELSNSFVMPSSSTRYSRIQSGSRRRTCQLLGRLLVFLSSVRERYLHNKIPQISPWPTLRIDRARRSNIERARIMRAATSKT